MLLPLPLLPLTGLVVVVIVAVVMSFCLLWLLLWVLMGVGNTLSSVRPLFREVMDVVAANITADDVM